MASSSGMDTHSFENGPIGVDLELGIISQLGALAAIDADMHPRLAVGHDSPSIDHRYL